MTAPGFRTDVNIRAPASQSLLDRPSNARGLLSNEFLDNAAESVNKQIDGDIKAMLDGFEALMGLSRIRDKDKFRIAQETFELEARADVMVRAAQSLTLLSHSLKLSLLQSQEPIESTRQEGMTLDEEAIELIKSTAREKEKCARILEDMFGLNEVSGEEEKNDSKGQAEGESNDYQGEDNAAAGQQGEILDMNGKSRSVPSEQVPDEEDLEMETVE